MLACLVTQLYPTLWTVARQVPLSIFQGFFSGKNTGMGCYFLPSEDLPDPGIKLAFPMSPTLQADSLSAEPSGKPHGQYSYLLLRSWFRTFLVVE